MKTRQLVTAISASLLPSAMRPDLAIQALRRLRASAQPEQIGDLDLVMQIVSGMQGVLCNTNDQQFLNQLKLVIYEEYINAQIAYARATVPPNSHAQPVRLKHDNPVAIRMQNAMRTLHTFLTPQDPT